MALNIKNPRAEELAAEVAKLSQTSMTQAVVQALEARREVLLRQRARKKGVEQARAFLQREVWTRVSPPRDALNDDALLGYGESGA